MHTYKCDILPQKHYKKVWYLLKHYKIKVYVVPQKHYKIKTVLYRYLTIKWTTEHRLELFFYC